LVFLIMAEPMPKARKLVGKTGLEQFGVF